MGCTLSVCQFLSCFIIYCLHSTILFCCRAGIWLHQHTIHVFISSCILMVQDLLGIITRFWCNNSAPPPTEQLIPTQSECHLCFHRAWRGARAQRAHPSAFPVWEMRQRVWLWKRSMCKEQQPHSGPVVMKTSYFGAEDQKQISLNGFAPQIRNTHFRREKAAKNKWLLPFHSFRVANCVSTRCGLHFWEGDYIAPLFLILLSQRAPFFLFPSLICVGSFLIKFLFVARCIIISPTHTPAHPQQHGKLETIKGRSHGTIDLWVTHTVTIANLQDFLHFLFSPIIAFTLQIFFFPGVGGLIVHLIV